MSIVDGGSEIPVGLGMRLSLDMEAMKNFVNSSDERKQQMVDYISASTTGDDAKNRVTEVMRQLHDSSIS